MTEMITARQSSDEIAPHDIFSMLLEAMDNEKDSSLKLNQRELLGMCCHSCIGMADDLNVFGRQYIHNFVRG